MKKASVRTKLLLKLLESEGDNVFYVGESALVRVNETLVICASIANNVFSGATICLDLINKNVGIILESKIEFKTVLEKHTVEEKDGKKIRYVQKCPSICDVTDTRTNEIVGYDWDSEPTTEDIERLKLEVNSFINAFR